MKISRMVYELEPYKDFILASEVKVDLRGQWSFNLCEIDLQTCVQNLVKLFLSYFFISPRNYCLSLFRVSLFHPYGRDRKSEAQRSSAPKNKSVQFSPKKSILIEFTIDFLIKSYLIMVSLSFYGAILSQNISFEFAYFSFNAIVSSLQGIGS